MVKDALGDRMKAQYENVTRSRWVTADPPIFTQDRAWLQQFIPRH